MFNLGFVIVTWADIWGSSFDTSFYENYFTNPLYLGSGVLVALVLSLVAAAAAGFIVPSGTKSIVYGLFTGTYWFMWGNTILIFSSFTTILGSIGMQMLGMITIIVVILFIVGITQCEMGGFASHE